MIKNHILKYEKYSIIVSIMLIILSIFLIGKPMESLETFVIAFAIIMIINGISNFVTTCQLFEYQSNRSTERASHRILGYLRPNYFAMLITL